ncbi:hypothetical protein FEM48_Zijuj08G0135700 [Ziziphus jujuba var. spinosa]|uniref:MADS-box domain-containing protein n=1 Tax=Ziziphus jujuba var. spinosa TaxID=714518 RepID=A0A978UZE4_ZIZJJ|nr:hypothetical protein FEM48_Zijuj08G0135700 [Ziziphus jujuba var. spinosa]
MASAVSMAGMGSKKTQKKTTRGTDARRVAVSRPQSGLSKNACEVCTLCAVETTLVVLSPGGQAFPSGHPCADSGTNRLYRHVKIDAEIIRDFEVRQEAVLHKLSKECAHLHYQIEAEKKRGEKLKQMQVENPVPYLLDAPIESLNRQELYTLKAMVEEVKEKVVKRRNELVAQASTPSSAADCPGTDPVGGNSSAGPRGHLGN